MGRGGVLIVASHFKAFGYREQKFCIWHGSALAYENEDMYMTGILLRYCGVRLRILNMLTDA